MSKESEESPAISIHREISNISIERDLSKVVIDFVENLLVPEEGEGDAEASEIKNEYSIKSRHVPHKDFTDAFKKLRKHALAIHETVVDDKTMRANYTISNISIKGIQLTRKSRVQMTIAKRLVAASEEEVITFNTPWRLMYDNKDYEHTDDMTKDIEAVLKEAWLYIGGKYASTAQLALFEKR